LLPRYFATIHDLTARKHGFDRHLYEKYTNHSNITGKTVLSNTMGNPENQPPGTSVSLTTLGCKLNQAETESLATGLAAAGYTIVPHGSPADICILNTCTVTATADAKARRWLRAARRKHPAASIIACGCYGDRDPAALTEAGADVVVGNDGKASLAALITETMPPLTPPESPASQPFTGLGRTRSLIKIQDGCRYGCAYCVVPLVRPREISLPPTEIISEIIKRQGLGYREIVLTGTKVGTYNHEQMNLAGLLRLILEKTTVPRLRLSSLQPDEISPELLDRWEDRRLCRHFHLALQNGSDSVLERMRRRYRTADYDRAIAMLRSKIPGVAVTTDIITGFPGESETEFNTSRDYCRKQGFARIHVFPYSRREGTVAASMAAQVDDKEKQRRTHRMLTLARGASEDFRRGQLEQSLPVLTEQSWGEYWTGLTDNYVKLYFTGKPALAGKIVTISLDEVFRDGVRGEIV
jgi:threonylcarbamoyladenosine tRNA methylthiotransferase MtaB